MIVREPHDEKRDRAQRNPHNLFGIKRERNPLVMCHAINRQNADPQDRKDQPDKTEVEIVKPPAHEHPIDHLVPCPPASPTRTTAPSFAPGGAERFNFTYVSISSLARGAEAEPPWPMCSPITAT